MKPEQVGDPLDLQARAWHDSLCGENLDIDWPLARTISWQIDAIAAELEYEDEYRLACQRHRFRIAASIRDLEGLLGPGRRALELGGTTFVTHLLLAHFPKVEWRTSRWDLRRPWPIDSESFDVVVATEVLEHLSDPEEGRNEQLELRGLRTCLTECRRILRPGGALFATTPNSASVVCLLHVLGGTTGINYPPHIREYCRQELERELHDAGFRIDSMRAVHCLALVEPCDYAPIFKALTQMGLATEDRGDDWFIHARRPRSPGGESEEP